jgi:hypothetical protein
MITKVDKLSSTMFEFIHVAENASNQYVAQTMLCFVPIKNQGRALDMRYGYCENTLFVELVMPSKTNFYL